MSKKTFNLRKVVIVAAATAGLLIAAPVFAASETGPGVGMGPGMMGGSEQECDMGPGMMGGHGHGKGPGMMGGHGHGYGMGPGMMRGMMGPGMMGGMMGPGMMGGMMGGSGYGPGMGPGMLGGGGYGMDSGMMGGYGGGYGMGPGMMGSASAPGLNLTDEQRAKASKIHDASRKKMWGSMGGMLDASSKLRELLSASTRDRAAISAAYKQVAELRQQMFEVGLDAKDEFERILSGDQRQQLRR